MNRLAIPAAIALLIFSRCGTLPTIADKEGGGSEIVARIVDSTGNALPNASIYVRPANYLPAPGNSTPEPDGLSDEKGNVVVHTDDSGSIVFEARYDTRLAAVAMCTVSSGNPKCDLGTIQLKSTGSLSGDVVWLGSETSTDYYALIYGLERTVRVTNGTYTLTGLAPSVYRLIITPAASTSNAPARLIPGATVVSDTQSRIRTALLSPGCDGYECDSSVIAHIVSQNNLGDIDIGLVTKSVQGRITSFTYNGGLISYLPGSIEYLSELRKLDVKGNTISVIPPEIGKLTKLDTLQIAENMLKEVPEEIGDLGALTYLRASRNLLRTLPLSVLNLNALTDLSVTHNFICDPQPAELIAWLDANDPDWQKSQTCE